jgi:hypothetical protein
MRTLAALALALSACTPADSDGGSAGAFEPIDGPAKTISYAHAYDQLRALASGAVTTATFGDAAAYISSDATSPTTPTELASLYYETDGLRAIVEGTTDTRPDRPERSDAGARAAQALATAFTLGGLSETPDGQRGSPQWHARTAVRRLDEFMLLRVSSDLAEHSAPGFDRALGYLIDADGAPTGLGKLIADADDVCGSAYFQVTADALGAAQGPFKDALQTLGLPDALDRLRINVGQSPEYDAALILADKALTQGLGTAFLALLEQPMTSGVQAEALAAFEALAADVNLAGEHACITEPLGANAVDEVFRALDAGNPADIDLPLVRCLVQQTLSISPCGS